MGDFEDFDPVDIEVSSSGASTVGSAAPVAKPVDDEVDHSRVQFLCKGAPQTDCGLQKD